MVNDNNELTIETTRVQKGLENGKVRITNSAQPPVLPLEKKPSNKFVGDNFFGGPRPSDAVSEPVVGKPVIGKLEEIVSEPVVSEPSQ